MPPCLRLPSNHCGFSVWKYAAQEAKEQIKSSDQALAATHRPPLGAQFQSTPRRLSFQEVDPCRRCCAARAAPTIFLLP
ncbi:MAG: hypothetical protein PHI97_18120 [Desulfobulbus sp.]|nr:hypothetical protein [Desulfobulbus sp.]